MEETQPDDFEKITLELIDENAIKALKDDFTKCYEKYNFQEPHCQKICNSQSLSSYKMDIDIFHYI